jgi:tetratricopeptide (TPR) repeat protein
MRPAIWGALFVSLGLVCAVRADPKVGSYAPDIEAKDWLNTDGQPLSLVECRGMTVVLFCWVSGQAGSESIIPLMTQINSSASGRAAGVFLIGVTDSERKRAAEMAQKEKAFFPIALEAKKTFDDYEVTSFPRVVIIDAAGKIAWAGWPSASGGGTLVEEIRKVQSETPPTRTHPEEAARTLAYLKQARQALRQDKYREAHLAATSAFGHALRGDTLKSRCQDMLDLVAALGRDKLAQAERNLAEKKYEDAVGLLLELRREFRGVDVARVAQKRLAALQKKRTEIAQIIQRQENAGQAESLLATALEQVRNRKFGSAYTKLEQITEDYSSTKTAAKARTLLERMQKDARIMAYVRDAQAARPCRTLLSQGEAYERTGQTSKARELYREILEKYPDTTYADEAAQRLARLP